MEKYNPFELLLSGGYCRRYTNPNNIRGLRVYNSAGHVLLFIREKSPVYRSFMPISREVKGGACLYLNLSAVRRLHGNNNIKKLYN